MGSESKPHFFKPFAPEMTSDRMRIPLPFMVFIEDENSQTFFLTGPSGNVWTVGLIQDVDDDDDYFFEEGWPDFVNDHGLEFEDICLFIYEGNLCFTFKILDETECEKESAFHVICSQDSTCSKRDDGKKVEMSNEAVNACESSHCNSKRKTNMAANFITSKAGLRPESTISRQLQVTAKEKRRALKAAYEFNSSDPFEVIVMRPSYVWGSLLPMPKSFKDSHLPKANREMILRDTSGNSWLVKYIVNSAKIGILSAGWSVFARRNNLEEGDVCIFELKEENMMQVHIFRVVAETHH